MDEAQFTFNLRDTNLLDALVFAIIVFSAGLSMARGLMAEMTSHGAWALSALITLFFVNDVAELLMPYLKDEFLATIFSTAGTFIISLIALSPIKQTITKKFIRPSIDIGPANNFFGLGFGLVKGWLLVTLGFLLLTIVYQESKESYPEWIQSSKSLAPLERSIKVLGRGMPEYMRTRTTKL
jgi:membrane protein required for colicin V production